ncbi:hypothetical protein [Nocardia sp. NPDC057353]|uniref:hypothetical protein n=1 Tax=Nocardia sp. NPDC057353 TaxID=3346104 RepID=UPI0036436CCE
MGSTSIPPRALTARETAVLTTLLSAHPEYAAQLPHTRAVATWGPESPSLDLRVTADSPRAADALTGILTDATVSDENTAPIGELLLWAQNGLLSAIEYAWYTDTRPHELPDPTRITVR